MTLSDFVRNNLEAILQDWEKFAGSIQPENDGMGQDELRGHARRMLQDIADDLDTPQSAEEQAQKSKGQGPAPASTSAASEHGVARLSSGFGISGVVSEYRALRGSVIRLWGRYQPDEAIDNRDLIRFNEAVDQQISEAVVSFSSQKQRQERLYEALLSSSPDHGYILDFDARFAYANAPMLHILDVPLAELQGKSLYDIGFPEASEMHKNVQRVAEAEEECRGEVTYSLPSGENRYYEYVYAPVFDETGEVEAVAASERDVTDRKASVEQAWRNANYDFLTGLPSRRLFRDRLNHDVKHAQRTGSSLAILFIDLDRFKHINDWLGHDAGDELLRQVTARLVTCVRAADTVARLGGDEFTVILQESGEIQQVAAVAKKILNQLALPFYIFGEKVGVSGSIGITLFPQDANEPEHLLRNADQAMYAAKKSGRNRYCFFTPKMQRAASARLGLLADLREALPRQQLDVFYQPIVELTDGKIVKAEALLRWHHPKRGLLLPADFIGLAEEAGLINEIGTWVFKHAAKHSVAWSELLNVPFQVSVNTSATQLTSDSDAKKWTDYTARSRLAKNGLSVEITEGALLDVSKNAGEQLHNIQDAGIELSIDGFGTGCSSLIYLTKCNVRYLKIDQSFVRGFTDDTSRRTVAETIIVMAHNLGLKAIAEGIETVEQRDWMTEAGCDYAQGYLFAQALPASDFGQLLKVGGMEQQ